MTIPATIPPIAPLERDLEGADVDVDTMEDTVEDVEMLVVCIVWAALDGERTATVEEDAVGDDEEDVDGPAVSVMEAGTVTLCI